MIKKFTILIFALVFGFSVKAQDLIITAAFDGPLSGGIPKGIELFATEDIADLSLYGISSITNGAGTLVGSEPEFTLTGTATKGDYIYIGSEAVAWNTFFGITPDFTTGILNVNGDDPIELYYDVTGAFTGSQSVIDIYGVADQDGTGEAWEYLDGWAYRKNGTTAGGTTFNAADWTFSGANEWDGESTNASASSPLPIGTYSEVLVVDPEPSNQPTSFSLVRKEFDSFNVSWTEAVAGTQAPTGYLILVSSGAIVDPVDGTAPSSDNDLTDGSAVFYVAFSSDDNLSVFNGIPGTTYNVAIYSYTNSGANIDFKVDAEPTLSIVIPEKIFGADFEGITRLSDIAQVSVHDIDTSNAWFRGSFGSSNFAQITEFEGQDVEEDWLIVGPFNFDAFSGETFSFTSTAGFKAGEPLTVRYSTNYAGDPTSAMWTDLAPTLGTSPPTGFGSNTYSGLLDVSAVSGQVVFAFYYKEDETPMSEIKGAYQIDDIKISGTKTATSVTTLAAANATTDLNLAGDATTTGNLIVNDLNLFGSILTVATGHTLTVLGDLDVDEELILESGASLITNGEVNIGGFFTIDRTTTFNSSTGRYSMIGSTVDGATTNSLGSLVYKYDGSVAFGADGAARFSEVTVAETMTPGVGYFSAFTGDVSLNGDPNNGGYVISPNNSGVGANDGFNLLANPYPSALDIEDFVAFNSGIDGSIYIWDDGGSNTAKRPNSDYITINAMGVATGGSTRLGDIDVDFLRSGQGFFVKATVAKDIVFANDMRASGNNSDGGFFRDATNSFDKISLSLSSDDFSTNTIIGFKEDATFGKDRMYDATKLSGSNNLQIYSLMQDNPYAIQGLPALADENVIVKLGYDASEAGIYTIKAEELTLSEGFDLILFDHLAGINVNLSDIGSYTFTTQSTKANKDRFTLALKTSVITEISTELANKLLIYADAQFLNVSLENGNVIDGFTIYSISGQQLMNVSGSEEQLQINKTDLANGVNIIKARSGQETYTLKFILD